MRLNEILDTIARAIALTANLPISFGQRREPKASLADDECPLLPSEDVDRIILPRGDGLQERYEVVDGVARLTIEPEPASASGHFSEEEIHQQAMRTQWLQRVVDEQTIPEGEPPRVRIRNREIQWSGTVVYPRQEMAEWLQSVVERTISQRQPFRGSPPLETLTRHACLNCAYFMAGRPSICNAFHTIVDSTAINDCADFELK